MCFENHLVAGQDRAAELDPIQAQQHRDLTRMLEFLRQQNSAQLRHGLDNQHAG
jgi:hypothetical protein